MEAHFQANGPLLETTCMDSSFAAPDRALASRTRGPNFGGSIACRACQLDITSFIGCDGREKTSSKLLLRECICVSPNKV